MHDLLRLCWAELFKLSRHRLVWVALVCLLAVLGLRINNTVAVVVADSELSLTTGEAPEDSRLLAPTTSTTPHPTPAVSPPLDINGNILPQEYIAAATLPGLFHQVRYSYDLVNVALMLLAMLVTGQEFSWGTMRVALTRGLARGQFILAKFLALISISAAYLLALWLACGLIGMFTTSNLVGEINFSFLHANFLWTQVAGLMRTWLATWPVIALALCLNLWIRRSGPSMMLSLMLYGISLFSYLVSTGLLWFWTAILIRRGHDPVPQIRHWAMLTTFLPHYNTAVLLHWSIPDKINQLDYGALMMAQLLDLPRDPWLALAQLLGVCCLLLVLAIVLFKRYQGSIS